MKNFDDWNKIKIEKDSIDRDVVNVFCKERQIWWISLGLNIGDEEDGKGQEFARPVLIIKKFNNNLFWACALSTKIKSGNKYYKVVQTDDGPRSVILSQFRLYDTKRLKEKVQTISKDDFQAIRKALTDLL